MTTQKFEVNAQQNATSQWKSAEFVSAGEAETAANLFRKWQWFNVNWNGVTGSADSQCVWVVRDGKAT